MVKMPVARRSGVLENGVRKKMKTEGRGETTVTYVLKDD
jgi:hypothetical protein